MFALYTLALAFLFDVNAHALQRTTLKNYYYKARGNNSTSDTI